MISTLRLAKRLRQMHYRTLGLTVSNVDCGPIEKTKVASLNSPEGKLYSTPLDEHSITVRTAHQHYLSYAVGPRNFDAVIRPRIQSTTGQRHEVVVSLALMKSKLGPRLPNASNFFLLDNTTTAAAVSTAARRREVL